MFTKAEWFQKRKYGGWGITPRTWQGWAYVGIFVGVLMIVQLFPFPGEMVKNVFVGVLVALFVADALRIMATLKKDELEEKNEATAERNASWAMVSVLAAGIIYQVVASNLKSALEVDPFLIGALIAGFAVKGISYFILEKK
jgi:hypothetical protein